MCSQCLTTFASTQLSSVLRVVVRSCHFSADELSSTHEDEGVSKATTHETCLWIGIGFMGTMNLRHDGCRGTMGSAGKKGSRTRKAAWVGNSISIPSLLIGDVIFSFPREFGFRERGDN